MGFKKVWDEMSQINFRNIPIINNKKHKEPSVFNPENLLREARRQKNIKSEKIPEICILDPDGDIVSYLLEEKKAKPNHAWACYHTQLYNFTYGNVAFGIIGCVVGSSFAVLVAEELFACGCQFLVSMTSAGQITPLERQPPYFILIEKALRDEGTSYHYQLPSQYSHIDKKLLHNIANGLEKDSLGMYIGASWTTDAPFRETESAIMHARSQGILAVEMEAAALYAFASAKQKQVVCLAHVTNQMGSAQNDFEKGINNGSIDSLRVVSFVVNKCLDSNWRC
ncbi:MAG: nucleoside phosphorylase [Candidatus Omnitrophota bacterium]